MRSVTRVVESTGDCSNTLSATSKTRFLRFSWNFPDSEKYEISEIHLGMLSEVCKWWRHAVTSLGVTRVVENASILYPWPQKLVSWSFLGIFIIPENRKSLKMQTSWGRMLIGCIEWFASSPGGCFCSESRKGRIWANLKENQCRSAKIENPKSCRKCREYLRGHPRTGPGIGGDAGVSGAFDTFRNSKKRASAAFGTTDFEISRLWVWTLNEL